jgi:nitroimidazol reductase NimA-like FMN-containing flavoprotein (pyridoxamine 5'-phosphate oxidase superfamily)
MNMRRKDREITSLTDMEAIIEKAEICHLGLCDNGFPYVIPLNFAYETNTFYFHCAKKGRKLEIIRENPQVCIQLETDCKIYIPEDVSETTMKYKCVIAFGFAEEVADFSEKSRILHLLLRRYTDSKEALPARAIENTGVLKVTVSEMTGKGNV